MAAATFPHRLAGHCGSGCLRDLLEHQGLDYGDGPLSEGACFGLAGGLGFHYEEPPGAPGVYLVGRTGQLEEDVAAHLGAGLELVETDDPGEGWEALRAELDAGRPTMVWADIAQLEYLRVRMSNTRHDVVVVGYDEAAGVALLADNDREALQRCSLASLARARASQAFPVPNHHRVFRYAWPAALPAPEVAVRRGMERAVANMTHTRHEAFGMRPQAGLDAVAAFAAAYPAWPDRLGNRLDAALGALRVLIVKAGTGGAMFRSLHARFLHDAAGWLADDRLEALGDHYDALAASWVALAAAAGERRHADGVAVVAEIAAAEATGVAAATDWLRATG